MDLRNSEQVFVSFYLIKSFMYMFEFEHISLDHIRICMIAHDIIS